MLPKLYFSLFVAAVSVLSHPREESPTRYGKNIEYFTGNIGEMIINNIIYVITCRRNNRSHWIVNTSIVYYEMTLKFEGGLNDFYIAIGAAKIGSYENIC